jgi:hypothetical protein
MHSIKRPARSIGWKVAECCRAREKKKEREKRKGMSDTERQSRILTFLSVQCPFENPREDQARTVHAAHTSKRTRRRRNTARREREERKEEAKTCVDQSNVSHSLSGGLSAEIVRMQDGLATSRNSQPGARRIVFDRVPECH